MKKNILLIAAAVLVVFASSCNRKVEFEHNTFATLMASSYSFDEDVQEVVVPVSIYNPNGKEVQVSVMTEDGKAEEGVDYEILYPVSGVLTFAAGEDTQEIVIGITEFPGKLTGSKDFSLTIASATEGFMVGNCSTAKLTIKDLDHPLKAFIGEWEATTVGYVGINYTWTMTIDGDESDPTYQNLIMSDFEPMCASYYKLTSADGYNIIDVTANTSKTRIIVPRDSYVATLEGEVLSISGVNAPTLEEASNYTDIYLDLSTDGNTLSIQNAWGVMGSEGFWDVIPGGLVFTKK